MATFLFGLIFILIGIAALLGFSLFRFIFAVIIIAIGVKLLMRGKKDGYGNESKQTPFTENSLNEITFFSPIYKTVKSQNFKSGKIIMIFSGGEIDLREAKTEAKEITIELVAIFGGVKITVPKTWRVSSQGTAIFGGYYNKTEQGIGEVTLNLKGSVVFGSIEITN